VEVRILRPPGLGRATARSAHATVGVDATTPGSPEKIP